MTNIILWCQRLVVNIDKGKGNPHDKKHNSGLSILCNKWNNRDNHSNSSVNCK